jgi:hypothetical protein
MDPVDFVGYIMMFLFGLGVLGIYQYNKSKQRVLPLSRQRYPNLVLEILVTKQHEKTRQLVVRVTALKKTQISRMYIELIGKNRTISRIGFAEKEIKADETTTAIPGQPFEIIIPLEEFKNYLNSQGIPFLTFRFVVDALPNFKHKTHELAFNRNWNIFRPDSGRYN